MAPKKMASQNKKAAAAKAKAEHDKAAKTAKSAEAKAKAENEKVAAEKAAEKAAADKAAETAKTAADAKAAAAKAQPTVPKASSAGGKRASESLEVAAVGKKGKQDPTATDSRGNTSRMLGYLKYQGGKSSEHGKECLDALEIYQNLQTAAEKSEFVAKFIVAGNKNLGKFMHQYNEGSRTDDCVRTGNVKGMMNMHQILRLNSLEVQSMTVEEQHETCEQLVRDAEDKYQFKYVYEEHPSKPILSKWYYHFEKLEEEDNKTTNYKDLSKWKDLKNLPKMLGDGSSAAAVVVKVEHEEVRQCDQLKEILLSGLGKVEKQRGALLQHSCIFQAKNMHDKVKETKNALAALDSAQNAAIPYSVADFRIMDLDELKALLSQTLAGESGPLEKAKEGLVNATDCAKIVIDRNKDFLKKAA